MFLPVWEGRTGRVEMLKMRSLARHELDIVWTIDRSEEHHNVYRMRDGELVLVSNYFHGQGWSPAQIAQNSQVLNECFDRGGAVIGMFDGAQIVGAAVVDPMPLGADCDQLQLKFLYVSRTYRGQGIGKQLLEEARTVARAQGAKALYISATPTENTVDFYRRCGAVVVSAPIPELYRLEPEDIHMVCPV
jgi:GNAT superfamily N-acetyltransferase